MQSCPNCGIKSPDYVRECKKCGHEFDEFDLNIDDKKIEFTDSSNNTQRVINKNRMKKCNGINCKLLVDANATECICGYKFEDMQKVELGNDSNIINRANINQIFNKEPIPGIIFGYIGVLVFCAFTYIISKNSMMGSRVYSVNSGISKFVRVIGGRFISFEMMLAVLILGLLIYGLIGFKSKICRFVLIIITFPVGLILLDPSVSKYTSIDK